MKIRLEQQNIGAAVMQIAEHEKFTAINALRLDDKAVPNAFVVNHDTAVFCKYASEPNGNGEYVFTFNADHLDIISTSESRYEKIFFSLVCVEGGEICCLTNEQFQELLNNRRQSAQANETQYVILVTIKSGSSLRAYVNAAGKRGRIAGKRITIPRKEFPNGVFT